MLLLHYYVKYRSRKLVVWLFATINLYANASVQKIIETTKSLKICYLFNITHIDKLKRRINS